MAGLLPVGRAAAERRQEGAWAPAASRPQAASRRHPASALTPRQAAFKKRTAYHDSFSAAGVTTLACATRGCVFSGQMSVDHVWKIVLPYEELGLKFRWAFLGACGCSSRVCMAALTRRPQLRATRSRRGFPAGCFRCVWGGRGGCGGTGADAAQFLCPICVYTQGHAEGYTWMGPEMFLTHISTHRGRDISPEGELPSPSPASPSTR